MTHTTLHLIFSPDSWLKAKALVDETDQVLFLQDSVYLLQRDLVIEVSALYARQIDVNTRNIKPNSNITLIDDATWVELTAKAHNIISW